jgi:L-lactate utilization protein LutB
LALLTLAVMQALLGFISEARWLGTHALTCGTCSHACPVSLAATSGSVA